MAKEIRLPDIGDFKDVPIIEVQIAPGKSVRKEETILTLESDKATMDVPAPADGVIGEVRVKVGDTVVLLPAIQAILRGQIDLAAKGNGPAQRAVIEKIQALEQELALEAAAGAAETKATEKPIPDRELARRIAWILSDEVPRRSPGGGAEGNETGPSGKSGKE